MPQPYTSLVPKHVTWFPDVATFARAGGVAPIDNSKPQKLWRDNSPYPSVGNFWGSLGSQDREYKFIARQHPGIAGSPLKLAPIDSPAFYATYAASMAQRAVADTYREFSYMFPQGVPVLESVKVPTESAGINLGLPIDGVVADYPIDLPSNIMLVVENGEVVAYDYQEFLRIAKPPEMPAADRLKLIDTVRQSPMPAGEQIKAIRAICTDWHPQVRTI